MTRTAMWFRRITARGVLRVVVQVVRLIVALAVGLGMGSRLIIVSGASMEPTMNTGDLLVVWPESSYEFGLVVTYQIPDGTLGEGKIVVHRMIDFEGDRLVNQGENNAENDTWNPAVDDAIGRRQVLIPGVGNAIALLLQPGVLASLAAGISTAWIVARNDDDGEEEDDTDREPATGVVT